MSLFDLVLHKLLLMIFTAEDIQAGKEALKLVHTLQEELAKLKKLVQILTSDLDEEV